MDNPYNMAVEGCGNEILIIKDNKIVGKGRAQMCTNYQVDISIEDEAGRAFFADDFAVKILGWKNTYFRYYMTTGVYLPTFMDEPDGRGKETRIVDAFKLSFGMVPDSFKDIEGYNSTLEG